MAQAETIRAQSQIDERPSKSPRNRWLPYLLILPLCAVVAVLVFYPTIVTFVQSFYIVNVLNPPVRFSGLKNYIDVLNNFAVTYSLVNTALYVLFGVTISTILGFIIALGLWGKFRGRAVFLAILILPWALPGITEGIIWQWIYDPTAGVLNSVLRSLHIIQHYQMWISSNRVGTIFCIELVQIWQMTPLSAVLILASLQGIPADLYDAAMVDGAGPLRTLVSITVQLIRPGLSVAVVESLIGAFNVFDQPYILNGNAPTGSSIMMQTYSLAFTNLNFGQAYALTFLTAVVIIGLSVIVLKLIYRRVEY